MGSSDVRRDGCSDGFPACRAEGREGRAEAGGFEAARGVRGTIAEEVVAAIAEYDGAQMQQRLNSAGQCGRRTSSAGGNNEGARKVCGEWMGEGRWTDGVSGAERTGVDADGDASEQIWL